MLYELWPQELWGKSHKYEKKVQIFWRARSKRVFWCGLLYLHLCCLWQVRFWQKVETDVTNRQTQFRPVPCSFIKWSIFSLKSVDPLCWNVCFWLVSKMWPSLTKEWMASQTSLSVWSPYLTNCSMHEVAVTPASRCGIRNHWEKYTAGRWADISVYLSKSCFKHTVPTHTTFSFDEAAYQSGELCHLSG